MVTMRTSGLAVLALLVGCSGDPFTIAPDPPPPAALQEAGEPDTLPEPTPDPEGGPEATQEPDGGPQTVAVGGYTGQPAGNGCVVFRSTWCGGGVSFVDGAGIPNGYAFVCPATVPQGPPGICHPVNTPSDGTTGWCCP